MTNGIVRYLMSRIEFVVGEFWVDEESCDSVDEVMFVLMVSDPNGETKWGFDVSANE